MNYRVYVITGERTERYAEAVNLSTADAVFAACPHYDNSVVELRYLDSAYTKWEVLARKGKIVKKKKT